MNQLTSKENADSAKCDYCTANTCPESHNGWFCTREKGHEGDHVACGGVPVVHGVHTWKQEFVR